MCLSFPIHNCKLLKNIVSFRICTTNFCFMNSSTFQHIRIDVRICTLFAFVVHQTLSYSALHCQGTSDNLYYNKSRVCLFVRLSVCPSVRLSICPSVRLSEAALRALRKKDCTGIEPGHLIFNRSQACYHCTTRALCNIQEYLYSYLLHMTISLGSRDCQRTSNNKNSNS